MNRRIKQVGLVLGTLALTAVFLAPVSGNNARARQAVPASPRYTAAAATTPGTPNNGAYSSQNYGDYMYGMMGAMMGPYWNYQGNGSRSSQGNYPYYGMMGGYWCYPGQSRAPGGVSGSVYGNQSGWSMPPVSI